MNNSENKVTKAQQREEAIKRLKSLKLHPNILNDFKEGVLNYCEHGTRPFNGLIYWVTDEIKAIVDKFEKEYNSVVYHVLKTPLSFGLCYSLLYVSSYPEEWERDNADLKAGYPLVYVENVDDEWCSEFGSIGIQAINGGLIRKA